MSAFLLAASNSGLVAGGTTMAIVYLAIAVLMIASAWKIYTKAGVPGWACIIPFYNIYKLLGIVGRPGWWLLLYFIPFVNVIVHLVVSIDLAKVFGKDTVFGVIAVWLFSIVGYPVLAFGEAQYQGAIKR